MPMMSGLFVGGGAYPLCCGVRLAQKKQVDDYRCDKSSEQPTPEETPPLPTIALSGEEPQNDLQHT